MIDMISRSEILERLKSLALNQTDDKVIKGINAAAFVVENAPDFTGYIKGEQNDVRTKVESAADNQKEV